MPLLRLRLLLLLLLAAASYLRLPPPAAAACSPKTCGGLNITYPFWLDEGDGHSPCGSPSFQLRCDGAQALLAHSISRLYQVVSIFTDNSSFIVVDHNLLVPSPGGCPGHWFNVSAGIGLAPYTISTKNRELLVLYNCTDRKQPQGFTPTHCGNGSSSSFFRLGDGYGGHRRPGALPRTPACNLSVVPVLGFPAGDAYVGGMKGGFLLDWTVPSDNCPRCVASGGQCRYQNDGTGFSCNCSGAVYPDECGDDIRCHVPMANTATKIGHPFSISPLNWNLLCSSRKSVAVARRQAGFVETVCQYNTFVSACGRYDHPGDYDIEGCNVTAVNVREPATGKVNASNYLELISDGFLLTWQQPPPAAAAGGTSGKLAHSSN